MANITEVEPLRVYVGADQLDTLASIKSKNELIADVVALLQSPAKNVVSSSSGFNAILVLEDLSEFVHFLNGEVHKLFCKSF